MRTYGQFCPVAQAMEVLGERWTLLVVRELICGSHRFSELQRGVPLMSRSMLALRLKTLEEAGIIERRKRASEKGHTYHLTPAGTELRPLIEGAGAWAVRWLSRDPRPEHLDARLLMWDVRRNIDLGAIPSERVLVQFTFPDAGRGQTRFWLHLIEDDVDLCMTKPAAEVDLHVESSLRVLTMVWLGDYALREAVRSGELQLSGARKWVRALPKWLKLSAFAQVERRS